MATVPSRRDDVDVMFLRHVASPLLIALVVLCGAPFRALSAQPAEQPHLKSSAELVRVDAVVLDRQGRAVPDLTVGDFEIRQDGKKQTVTTLAFVEPSRVEPAGGSLPAIAARSTDASLKGVAAIYRTVAIVVDDLGMSFTSIDPVQRALRRFIDEQRQPGDLVAIIRTGKSQSATQRYTRDSRRLHAAVDAIRWNLRGGASVGGLSPVERDPIDRLRPGPAGPAQQFAPGESPDWKREVSIALGTFGALRAVVQGAGSLPGRKSVVLISQGVRPFDHGLEYNPRIEDAVREVVREAARFNVTINTIDPRGLEVAGLTAADDVQGLSPGAMVVEQRQRRGRLQAEQDSLKRLAEDTGGIAVIDSNDLLAGLRRAMDDQNGYYLLGYVPPADTRDNRFHRIKVSVKRKGIRVRARPGFYGGRARASRTLLTSLFSPVDVSTVGLRLTPIIGQADNGDTVVRLLLHIDAGSLSFAEADGWQTTKLDVIGRTLDTDGDVVDATGWRYDFRTRSDEYAKTLAQGLLYRNQIVVKRPGFYRVSVGVADVASGTFGTASQFIEVPDLRGGLFATSGLLVSGEGWTEADANGETLAALAGPAVRVFAPGMRLTWALEVYNVPSEAPQPGRPPMAVEVRLMRDGKEVLSRPAGHVTPLRQGVASVWGELDLPAGLPLGDYALEVRAGTTDAKGIFRVATQSTDLTVR